jgi:hypothetical protein
MKIMKKETWKFIVQTLHRYPYRHRHHAGRDELHRMKTIKN